VRGRSGGIGAEAVADVEGEGAPVSGRAVDGRRGRELQVRCQSGEVESWRGGERTRQAAAGESEGGPGAVGEQLSSRQRPPAGGRGRRRCRATVLTGGPE
jgi:hypothetical protein